MVHKVNPACLSCGIEIHDDGAEQSEAWLDGVCGACFGDSRVAQTTAKYFEAVSDFRWFSRDWLKCHACQGSGLADGDGENGFCGCHVGRTESSAHVARGELYRGTYEGRAQIYIEWPLESGYVSSASDLAKTFIAAHRWDITK